jgi:outer membrane protein assembly factor BamE (lipoprotein component of BamABCDE complex)
MESRIEELKQKYWEGNTSLDEEAELKSYYAHHKTMGAEARYFDTLSKAKDVHSSVPFPHPEKRHKMAWMAMAASVLIGALALAVFMQPKVEEDPFMIDDPKLAYEITRNAMMMMSSGLNQGAVATTELSKINKVEEILTIN